MGFSLATGQPQWLGYDGADDQTPDRDDSTPMQLLLLLTNLESTWRQSHPPSQTARENIEDQSALSDHLKCIYDTLQIQQYMYTESRPHQWLSIGSYLHMDENGFIDRLTERWSLLPQDMSLNSLNQKHLILLILLLAQKFPIIW